MNSPYNAERDHFIREYSDCGICYLNLARKRTVGLLCGHEFHRTCVLDWCESSSEEVEEELSNRCPNCNVPSGSHIRDENNRKLPTVFGFGPTGQPSKQLVVSLLNNPYAIRGVHDVLTDTVHFLRDVTDDLLSARKRCETEEHIQDVIMERNKLLDRFAIIDKLLQEHETIKARINSAINPAHNQTAFAVQRVDNISNENCEDVCGICFEKLNDKYWITLTPCQHYFHRVCILGWFESLESENRCPDCNGAIGSNVRTPMRITLHNFLFFTDKSIVNPIEVYKIMERAMKCTVIRIQNYLKMQQFSFSSGVIAGCIRWNYLHEGFEELLFLVNRYVLIDAKFNELTETHNSDRRCNELEHEMGICTDKVVDDITSVLEEDECPCCLEPLSSKRTIRLEVCSHRYHRTCALQWYEAKEVLDDLFCCICQRPSLRILDNEESEIMRSYPFEDFDNIEDFHFRPELLNDIFNDYRFTIGDLFKNLLQDKRMALKNGKSGEYVTDIDDEMEKLKRRSVALDNHNVILAENEALDRMMQLTSLQQDDTKMNLGEEE